MDYNQFKKLLENGEMSKRESLNVLFEFVNEFPYFQTAQAMLAKAMHEQQHVRYERQLKTAAAYSGDRKSLLNMIHPGEAKIFNDKPNVIERPEIPESVFEEEKPELIFSTEFELSVPSVEETFEEEIYKEAEVPTEHYKIPAPVVYYSDDMNYDEMEPEDDYDEPKAADPHEIIRRRLNEILGFKEELKINPKPDLDATDIADKQIQAVETIKDETEVSNEVVIKEETKEGIEELSNEEIKEKSDGTENNFLDRITIESKKVLDVIDKGELEYALEATLIHSLESLPVIEKTETDIEKSRIEEKIQEKEPEELTFFEWLKYKSNSDYGIIEEVHAYDPIRLVEIKEEEHVENRIEESDLKPLSIITDKQGIEKLIDRFIESDPKIVPSRIEFYSPVNQAKKSITENEDIVSETLAKIYHQQGNLLKARSTYEKLSLLNPEKMTYFAALISEIDKTINNQDKQDI